VLLFFDTETSDLPRDFRAPETDVHNWPHLVQVGWVLTEVDGAIVDSQVHLIRPEGFQISPGSFNKHGISTAYATEHGVGIVDVLTKFAEAAQGATNAIAHNLDFDSKVMGAAFTRIRVANPLRGNQLRCTMTEATN
jgi:DNA polymerase III epsilon subunit-like protein